MALRLVIANWKMQLSVRQAVHVALSLRHSQLAEESHLVLCPSFTALSAVSRVLHGTRIELGAQNVAAVERGAITGEVSIDDLRDLGCTHVVIGHSDRRALGETDTEIRKKLSLTLASGLTPVLCVGERLAERKAGTSIRVVKNQLRAALHGVTPTVRRNRVLIAYEPVWAISPGGPITPSDAFTMVQSIWLMLGARANPLIYGGNVTPANCGTFLDGDHFFGVLVGKAALTARSLVALMNG